MNVDVNYLAVFLAAVSSMVVGSLWYMPGVFGKAWMKMTGITMDKNKGMSAGATTWMYGSVFVASLVTAYVLAHVTFLSHRYFGNSLLQDALSTAFWLWLGFVAARFVTHDAFEGRRKKLTLLNLGNELVTLLVMGLVIGAMGV